jgi:hypothetical protein
LKKERAVIRTTPEKGAHVEDKSSSISIQQQNGPHHMKSEEFWCIKIRKASGMLQVLALCQSRSDVSKLRM